MSVADASEAQPLEPALESAPPAPRESDRIVALDVARGFALLGIVLVNIDLFSLPIGILELPGPYEHGLLPMAAWVFMAIFCQGKFYPLFALLFGMGAVLQRDNVAGRGGNYTALGLRRMAILLCFGLAHVVLLWYGDILLFYATAGMVLVLVSGWRSTTLIKAGIALIVVPSLLTAALVLMIPAEGYVSSSAAIDRLQAAREMDVGSRPFNEVFEKLIRPQEVEGTKDGTLYLAGEMKAYQEGGFFQALGFRALSWAAIAAAGVLGFWWIILGIFMLGAGLIKGGLFEVENEGRLLRFMVLAMALGLPVSALAVVAFRSAEPTGLTEAFALTAPLLIGPVMALGYLSAITLVVRHRFFLGATNALAATGRMALTNYLGQSVVLAFVFYHWGLGYYGQLAGHERLLVAVGLFLVQVVISQWWLARFRFGPLEWLWRSTTYGRLQPMRRG